MEIEKGTKYALSRYYSKVKRKMNWREDTRYTDMVGLIIERVGGSGEHCWSDGSAELKPSSGSLSCPADVKVSASGGEKQETPGEC